MTGPPFLRCSPIRAEVKSFIEEWQYLWPQLSGIKPPGDQRNKFFLLSLKNIKGEK